MPHQSCWLRSYHGCRHGGEPRSAPEAVHAPARSPKISGSFCQNAASWFLRACVEPCGSVAARRIPAGFRPNCRFRTLRSLNTEGSGAPKFAAADRRDRWPALRRGLSRQRTGLPAHNADRRASRRPTAAFSLDLGTAFWRRQEPQSLSSLIPQGFSPCVHPLHQSVAGRTHVVGPGDVS